MVRNPESLGYQRPHLKARRLYLPVKITDRARTWLVNLLNRAERKLVPKKEPIIMANQFPEVSKRLKKEIERILNKAREDHLAQEMLEIYDHIIRVLVNIQYLPEQELFPFEDTILAWDKVLKASGAEKAKMSDILLGITLATLYERGKEKGG